MQLFSIFFLFFANPEHTIEIPLQFSRQSNKCDLQSHFGLPHYYFYSHSPGEIYGPINKSRSDKKASVAFQLVPVSVLHGSASFENPNVPG